jgi:hypothetical protein
MHSLLHFRPVLGFDVLHFRPVLGFDVVAGSLMLMWR